MKIDNTPVKNPSSENEKTILITGGCGFIGSQVVRTFLKETSYRIVNVDLLTYAGNLENLKGVQEGERYRFYKEDIASPEGMEKIFQKETPSFVVNLAAESHVDRSVLDAIPFVRTNVLGVQNLLDLSRKYRVEKFLQISTDEVYGSTKDGAFTEKSPLNPSSPYSASKASADLLVLSYFRTFQFPGIIVRPSNNYGPRQFPEKLIPLMLLNALEKKPLPVYGTGKNIREWIYVEDTAKGILSVLLKGKPGEIYNLGSGEERTNIEIVHLLLSILARKTGSKVDSYLSLIQFVKDRPGHDFRYRMDSTKIRKELNFHPSTSLEEGLDITVQWYLENVSWWRSVRNGEYLQYYERVYKKGWQ
jgi:dTDP-glucose 4,6-dehydratase